MLDLDSMMLDETLVAEGVWVDWKSETRLKLSCTELPTYKGYVSAQVRKNRYLLEDQSEAGIEMMQGIMAEGIARFLILDWEGFTSQGQSVPYNPGIGKIMLTKDPAFRDFVFEKTKDFSLFRAAVLAV